MSSATKPPKFLNFITGNANKLAEVRSILAGTIVELQSKAVDVPEIQAASVEDVTRDKCLRAAEAVNGPVLVEDTCLVFNAWGELPGPYIKWFLKQFGPMNLHKLLEGFPDKSAQAICTFGYAPGPGLSKQVLIFQGRTDGKIVPARGPQDFGWDSAFEHQGRTYAEMRKPEKNAVSHRGKALEELKMWLESDG